MKEYKEMYFYLDCLPYYFKGFSYGGCWNGWSCPLFDKETTIKILEYMKKEWGTINYTIVNDTIIYKDENEDEFETISPNEKGFYGLGGYSWTWSEISENDLKEQIWNSYKDNIVKWGD